MTEALIRQRSLVTPEGLDLNLRLAEASERAAAFFIDVAIIVAGLVVLMLICIAAFAAMGVASGPYVAMIWLLGFFVLRNLYFMLFEMPPRAATPGKRMLGLRVASRSGGPLTADAILGRNAMRELEVYLPLIFLLSHLESIDAWVSLAGLLWTGVFAFMPLFNRDRLRAGDIAAGTWVVKTPRRKLLKDLAERENGARERFVFTQAQLDAYGVKELHVLEDVLRRFDARTVKAVAERIRRKIDWPENAHESDGDFLDAYYRALRGRLETRLLFGKRRVDKFDRD